MSFGACCRELLAALATPCGPVGNSVPYDPCTLVTRKQPVTNEARLAINDYIDEERGKNAGPLFLSKTGQRLSRQHVYSAIKRIAGQANSTLPPDEQISVSPHVLRHTALRALADSKGVHFAMQASGNVSTKHIWRYVKPGFKALADAMEDV